MKLLETARVSGLKYYEHAVVGVTGGKLSVRIDKQDARQFVRAWFEFWVDRL